MTNITLNTPKSAQDARRMANSFAKAQAILEEGYRFTQENGMVAVVKPGELHAAYWIGEHADGTSGCDCPDFVKHGKFCKHTLAVGILAEQEAQEEAMWNAICAQYEEEEGWADGVHEPMPQTTTAQFLEALQARMCSDLNKAEAAIAKQKSYEVTGHDCTRFNLNVGLRVIGLYWNLEMCGRLNLMPAHEVKL